MASTRLARRRGFQCLHQSIAPEWTDSAKSSALGACFTPRGHAHNYQLEVYIEGPMDSVTGMVMNVADVDAILERAIEPLEGKCVHLEVPDLKDITPTTERLAHFLLSRLQPRFTGGVRLIKIRLYEYEDLWVDLWN